MVFCMLLVIGVPAFANHVPVVTGKVVEVTKYGHARLDVTIESFDDAGFELGDIVDRKGRHV